MKEEMEEKAERQEGLSGELYDELTTFTANGIW